MKDLAPHGVAFATMLAGSAMVFGLLLVMNGGSDGPEEQESRREVAFEVAPAPKPPKKEERPKPPPRKAKPQPTTAPPPMPDLASSLASVSLGRPAVDVGAMGGAVDQRLLGDVKASVMTEDAVDAQPRPVRRSAAPYPPRARAQGITGQVTLNLLIDERGAVQQVKVLEASPPGTFEEAAREAVRSWTFEPATYQGEPVKVWARQTVRFDLT